METLKKQVRRAERRLAFQHFLHTLSWCLFFTLLAAAVMILIGKFWQLGITDWQWAAGAGGLGLLAAVAYTIATRRGSIDAAVEIDRRFGLKERVSSTLGLAAEDSETPAGRALTADAIKRVEQIHVPERFSVSLDRWSWLPLVPAAIVFLLAVFLEPQIGRNPAQATQDVQAVRKQIKQSSDALRKRLLERRKEAREKGLADAEEIFQRLERGTKQLAETQTDRKKAMVELNDLAKELEQRRASLGDNDQLKQQLNQLKDLKQGPADNLAKALKNGDLKQAINELEKLKQQLQAGKLDKEAQEKLADQMAQMQQKLNQIAEQQERKMEELKQRIQQKRQAGQNDEANELQRQLEQMQNQQAQTQQMKDLAQKLGQCAQCMKQGDSQQAQQAMEELQADLNNLQAQLEEMQMLDQTLDEIAECKACMGGLMGNRQNGRPGFGLGEGRGQGERPEEKDDVKFHNSQVKQKTGRGAAVMAGYVDGPNVKGKVQQEVQLQFEEARTEDADPLTGQRLPKDYQDHTRGYFDAFREGEKK